MLDFTHIIQASTAHAWLYLPVAVILGALHALEPGHAKSLMAAYIISIRGTASQAAMLGLAAAVGHTIVVWVLAILGLALGNALIVEQAEPWLTLLSGILVMALAARMRWGFRRRHTHDHAHGDNHDHDHGHDHPHEHRHTVPSARTGDIIWFGFTGGLLPCPTAIAVLLVCIQLRQFTLGVMMVAAFSVGLAVTLVSIGVAAAWGARRASARWPWFDRVAGKLPFLSAGLVMTLGVVMAAIGLNGTGLLGTRKPS
jgi:nickel/cobalt transporter (NicO) family protein